MGSMEELERRVAALETQMHGVRDDAAAARVLAGGADRDVSAFGARLDAHQRLLEALRETQIEHGQRLARHDKRFDRLDQRFDGLDQRFDGLDQRFGSLDQRFGSLEGRFDGLEGRFGSLEGRFDGLDQRFDGLEGRFGGVEGRFDGLENRMHQGFAGLERNQAVILDLLRRRNGHDDGPPPAE